MQLNEAVKEAIKILSEIHVGNMTPIAEEAWKSAIKILDDGLQLTQQKPVAWICAEWSGSGVPELSFDGPPQELSVRDELTRPVWTPLYTALYTAPQPARQPLTEEQVWVSNKIMAVNADIGLSMVKLMMITRAVEAAHGIK